MVDGKEFSRDAPAERALPFCILYFVFCISDWKAISIVAALVLLPLLAGCGGGANASSSVAAGGAPSAASLNAQTRACEQQVQQLGGSIEVKVNLAKSSLSDETLLTLPLPENVSTLDLSATKITDAGLANLKKARRLKELYLVGVPITDAGLVHLRELPELESVDLRDSKVSSASQWALMKELRQRAFDRQHRK